MHANDVLKKRPVSKIAFLNPYLPAGHFATAEIETTARLIQAGKNINVEIKAFGSCEEIEYFEPDFVFVMCFQVAKLTRFPTYGHMDVPPTQIGHVPRFLRNVLTWDGCFAISESAHKWLNELHRTNNKKFHIAHAGVSVPQTEFKPADYKNAVAMYIGTNWDGQRHNNLFGLLDTGEYLKCYGPKKSWAKYPSALYGGEVPFDGVSVLAAYNKSAAGLCIGHPLWDSEGTPSSRTYEIAAASAVPICSDISLNRNIYGDAALYINKDVPTAELVEQIIDRVKWIRSNPRQAEEIARQAHTIFNKDLSMEFYLKKLIAMHEQVLIDNHYSLQPDTQTKNYLSLSNNKVTYILAVKFVDYRLQPILQDLASQSHRDIEVILLAQNGQKAMEQLFGSYCHGDGALRITYLPDDGETTHLRIFDVLKENNSNWFSIITIHGRLFPNHVRQLLDAYQKNTKNQEVVAVYSRSLEFSDDAHLPELEPDEHLVPNEYRIRLASVQSSIHIPLHSILISCSALNMDLFKKINLYDPVSLELVEWLSKVGLQYVSEVTCATKIHNDSNLLNQIRDLRKGSSDMQQVIADQRHVIAELNSKYAELNLIIGSWLRRCFYITKRVIKKIVSVFRRGMAVLTG